MAAGNAASRETRGQAARGTGERAETRTRGEEIQFTIEKIRGSFGQKGTRDARPVLYDVVAELLTKVER